MKSLMLITSLVVTQTLHAQDVVTVPWSEFRDLYKESIERNLAEQIADTESNVIPQEFVINQASYQLHVDLLRTRGDLVIDGKVLSGTPEPIPVFDAGMVISKIGEISGGSLINNPDNPNGARSFLPSGTGAFHIALSFLSRVEPSANSFMTKVPVPAALQNTLKLELADGLRLLGAPGIADDAGVFHFSSPGTIIVQFAPTSQVQEVAESVLTDIDVFSAIAIQRERVMLTTTLIPVSVPKGPITLVLPKNAQYLSSSLPDVSISRGANGQLFLKGITPDKGVITLQASLSLASNAVTLILPTIEDNHGRSGDFLIEQPSDGQAVAQAEELIKDIPAASLNPAIIKSIGPDPLIMHVPADRPLQVQVRRFEAVAKPALIVDSQNLFVTVDESGTMLSTLSLTLPQGHGSFLRVKALPGSDVWSVTVNGQPRELFASDDHAWLIPLEKSGQSVVTLSLRRKGEKLGLHGKLDMDMPETGVLARQVRCAIALPVRVDLLSMEGPVNPSTDRWGTTPNATDKVHFFSSAFHTGDGMRLTASYKEPIKLNR